MSKHDNQICVKDAKTGDIVRMSRSSAKPLIDKKSHVYTSKGSWKAKGRKKAS